MFIEYGRDVTLPPNTWLTERLQEILSTEKHHLGRHGVILHGAAALDAMELAVA